MSILATRLEILNALSLLREDADKDERKKQNKMKREIKKVKEISEEDEDEDEDEEGAEETPAEESGEEDKEKSKPKSLPGAKELKNTPAKLPSKITGVSIVDRVNKIRAGASLKSDKILKKIDTYVMSLDDKQQQALYTYLDALARIILADMDPAEVPIPQSITGANVDTKTSAVDKKIAKEIPKNELPIVSPVVVGEGARKKLSEIDVPIRSGRVVPFGSKAHVTDLEDRIDDLVRIKSYQEQGSESRHSLSLAVAALKSQLRSAMRKVSTANPRIEPIPPMVEKK